MRDVAPGLVPSFDVTVHLVLDDFGHLGRAYPTTYEEKADRDTVILKLLSGEYNKPVRVVAFNTAEFWSRDVSEAVAWEVVNRAVASGSRLPEKTYHFVAFHLGEHVALRAENSLLEPFDFAGRVYREDSAIPMRRSRPRSVPAQRAQPRGFD